MLNLIFGSAGAGKTHYTLENIKKSIADGRKTYLLVPEQQVYISECMLSDLPPSSALLFEVVSFSRLADKVFSKYGGLSGMHLSSGTRNLIMWQNLRSLDGLLYDYKISRSDKALAAMMLSMVDELSANSIRPEELEQAISECKIGGLSGKLHDLSLIYANFEENLVSRLGEGAHRAETKFRRMASLLSKHDFFSGCDIYVDSFTDFTGEEHGVLREIMAQANSLTVTLCYGGRGCRNVYSATIADTLRTLTKNARLRDVEIKEVVLRDNHRAKNAELSALRDLLWDLTLTSEALPTIPEEERGAIELCVCQNEYEEAELAALKILSEHKRGVGFSEMAVVIRDAETRAGIINTVFEKYNIPYFYSEKTDLSSSAAARLMLSALRVVSRDFRLRDILTLIKTGLCGISLYECDLFEEYCLTWNISGKTFFEPVWSMNPDGFTVQKGARANEILESANRVRAALIPPLERLSGKLSASEGDVTSMCLALYEYLCEIDLSKSISAQAELALSAGDVREAGELIRLYDCIIGALASLSNTLSDARMKVDEMIVALEILLSGSDIASVPSVSDYVTVGSASTLRVENMRTMILLGLCEGEFPGNFSESGLLSEVEKAELSELGIHLKSREEKLISDELFFAWRAMTRPSEHLILSTLSSSISGGKKVPSSAFNRVRFLFPYIEIEKYDAGRVNAFSKGALPSVKEADEPEPGADITLGTAAYETVDPHYVRMLFGNDLMLTKSKINTFVGCPYSYWSQYVLHLRERKSSQLSYGDSGSFIHFIFEKFLSSAVDESGRIREMTDEEILGRANEISMEYIQKTQASLDSSVMYSLSRLRNLSLVMLKSIIAELEASPFRVVAFEQNISGRGSEALSPLRIKVFEDDITTPTVSLGGTVDRIDIFESCGRTYLRIIDYKTGNKEFSPKKIPNGEDIQLPAYLFTVASEQNRHVFAPEGELIAASALYLSAGEKNGRVTPLRSGFILEDEEMLAALRPAIEGGMITGASKKKDGTLSGNAIIDKETMDGIEHSLRESVSSVARRLYSGNIEKKPGEDACRYCAMRESCADAIKPKRGGKS